MEWISNNLSLSFIFMGLSLLAIEVVVLGFALYILFFVGLASLVTGILMYMAVIPETPASGLLWLVALTLVSAVLLWRPLRTMQRYMKRLQIQRDLIGYTMILKCDVTPEKPGRQSVSGRRWKVYARKPIEAGTVVEVVEADIRVLHVMPKDLQGN